MLELCDYSCNIHNWIYITEKPTESFCPFFPPPPSLRCLSLSQMWNTHVHTHQCVIWMGGDSYRWAGWVELSFQKDLVVHLYDDKATQKSYRFVKVVNTLTQRRRCTAASPTQRKNLLPWRWHARHIFQWSLMQTLNISRQVGFCSMMVQFKERPPGWRWWGTSFLATWTGREP